MAEKFAFIRVSTKKQKEARQIARMLKLGIYKKNIIIEKESGKSTERLKYKNLVKHLKTGDTLYIENIDRLGRDYDTILEQWNLLTRQKSVTTGFITTQHNPAWLFINKASTYAKRYVIFYLSADYCAVGSLNPHYQMNTDGTA